MPSLSLRPATPADIPTVLQFIKELAEYEKSPEQARATLEQIRTALFGELHGRRPLAECIIGEIDGSPQGLALYFENFSTWTGKPGIYLEDLFVRPAARGIGLGKALFTRVAKIAVERGCSRYEWAVLDWNSPAIDFYKAMGAVPMNEWTVYRLEGPALARIAE